MTIKDVWAGEVSLDKLIEAVTAKKLMLTLARKDTNISLNVATDKYGKKKAT